MAQRKYALPRHTLLAKNGARTGAFLIDLGVAIAITMAFGMSANVFAASIDVQNVLDGETYTAYKILNYTQKGTAYSYYACFQTLGTSLIFDPIHDKSDLNWMRAVANAWNDRYPSSPRTENLCNIVQECRRNQAKPRQIVLDIDGEKVRELGIIDMTFPDIRGQEQTLSSLRGNVVLLDFTAFSLDGSTERTLLLRELYNKYHDRGFEIYQVSVDPNEHLWKQRCEALPWVSVYCEEGLESDMLTLYDVQSLPYYFLIDRNCDLQARQEYITDLEAAIEALL